MIYHINHSFSKIFMKEKFLRTGVPRISDLTSPNCLFDVGVEVNSFLTSSSLFSGLLSSSVISPSSGDEGGPSFNFSLIFKSKMQNISRRQCYSIITNLAIKKKSYINNIWWTRCIKSRIFVNHLFHFLCQEEICIGSPFLGTPNAFNKLSLNLPGVKSLHKVLVPAINFYHQNFVVVSVGFLKFSIELWVLDNYAMNDLQNYNSNMNSFLDNYLVLNHQKVPNHRMVQNYHIVLNYHKI
ncbi:hypothetical protein AGLY_017336 [Aphis glycines]|uniref:Uncharacterized protein n=1 Tax=Aphis glycines TaxID=307491 RepID=A0A6G0SV75_APHGL|nr:hypothetical protein AGLY_017336 [Aphis glycines]